MKKKPTRQSSGPLCKWSVQGWFSGEDYSAGFPASCHVTVSACSERGADEKGDALIAKKHGRCEVIVSTRV